MKLNPKTLEYLRVIINGDGTEDYRSGPQLCAFFNQLGFEDDYWKISRTQGFPSRKDYTDIRLKEINGTPEIDKCIRNVFAVNNFIQRIDHLDKELSEFNKYLAFDKWQVVRDNAEITFRKIDKVVVEAPTKNEADTKEDEFLKQRFDFNIESIKLEASVIDIIKARLIEIKNCVNHDSPLSAVIMTGSVLEGLLFSIATQNPREYNQSQSAPKDENGRVRKFSYWTLNNFIDVSAEVGVLKQDVKKFSHVLRDFRNYIHPYSQMCTQFSPDKHTALICLQVLNAALFQIETYQKKKGE